jgi:hypothetical protein
MLDTETGKIIALAYQRVKEMSQEEKKEWQERLARRLEDDENGEESSDFFPDS